jgi:hypothetical protein
MSKKSRKRNKKILAAIGIGLGAAALASRKNKSDLASTEDNKSGSTKITGGTNLNDYDGSTKKDTSKSDTPIAKDTNKGSGSNVRTRQKVVNSSGDTVASAGTAIADNKSKVTDILPPSQNTNMYSKVGNRNPKSRNFRKDGGRAEYKSGGKVKGCGKALRGFGKAMKGNR